MDSQTPPLEQRSRFYAFIKRYFSRVIHGPEDIPVNIKYGNDQRVANNVWKTIQNPVTVAMITGEEGIPPSSVSGESTTKVENS